MNIKETIIGLCSRLENLNLYSGNQIKVELISNRGFDVFCQRPQWTCEIRVNNKSIFVSQYVFEEGTNEDIMEVKTLNILLQEVFTFGVMASRDRHKLFLDSNGEPLI